MDEIIQALDEAFEGKGLGKVEMPPKPGIHTKPDAFIHAMPAAVPSFGAAGCKWVSGYPENYKKNLPYINGLLILNDPETGVPLSTLILISRSLHLKDVKSLLLMTGNNASTINPWGIFSMYLGFTPISEK